MAKRKIVTKKKLAKLPAAKRMKALASNDEILSQEIAVLIKELHAANSYRQKFFSSIIQGFATVIGATLLVAIAIYILTQLATIEFLRPFVQAIVDMVKNSYR